MYICMYINHVVMQKRSISVYIFRCKTTLSSVLKIYQIQTIAKNNKIWKTIKKNYISFNWHQFSIPLVSIIQNEIQDQKVLPYSKLFSGLVLINVILSPETISIVFHISFLWILYYAYTYIHYWNKLPSCYVLFNNISEWYSQGNIHYSVSQNNQRN